MVVRGWGYWWRTEVLPTLGKGYERRGEKRYWESPRMTILQSFFLWAIGGIGY